MLHIILRYIVSRLEPEAAVRQTDLKYKQI